MKTLDQCTQEEKDELMSLDVNPISPMKMEYINELRKRCQDLFDSYNYPDYITCDIELLRFVRGYMFNIDEATASFRKMLTWRKEQNVDSYFEKVKAVDFDIHKVPYADVFEPIFQTNYHHKEDKEGRFIDIRLLGSIDVAGITARPLQEWIDYNIYTLEWRIYLLNKLSAETGTLQRLTCIQDLKGVGMHMISPSVIKYFKAMSAVTSHNYPETMHKSFITNAPGIFSSLWSIAKPVMHPRTVKKFTILKSDFQEELYKFIDVQNLPAYLGGICRCRDGCLCGMRNEENFSIPVSKYFTMPIHVKKGDKISWHWKVESGDITNIVRFKDASGEKEVYKGERITDHSSEFEAPEDGTISFFFDNSFSWLSNKVIIGMVDIN